MDGQARIQGAQVDIGADESDGSQWPPVIPVVVRVSSSGDDAHDGSSWALAKRTVQAGVNAAKGHGGEVWVAAGSYAERIVLPPYVSLYGGFAGAEASRDQRDWSRNATVLDGGGLGSVVQVQTGHRVSRIDGFAIRNGNGGGIRCTYSSPTITNNTIAGNSGGGIYCGSSALIANNTISGNSVSGSGGGILCGYSSATIANNISSDNSAGSGGGIFCGSSSPTIANNTITANSADYCGGIYCYSSSPTIANNTIAGNSGGSTGGGIYCDSSSPAISNNIVAFNSGGIYRDDRFQGSPTLQRNCVFNPDGYNYSGLNPGATDIHVDPLFVNRAAGDYHLSGASPCINAGDDSVVQAGGVDMDGEARIMGAHVDIGSDELDPNPISVTLPAGWNLISLPAHPLNDDPAVVFTGLPINDQLVRWDCPTLSYVGYWDLFPSDFGPLKVGEGHWLMLDQPTTISYQGYPTAGTGTVPLPQSGWHLIGQPHNGSTDVNTCSLTGTSAPPVCSVMPIYGWYPAELRYWEVGCDGAPVNDSKVLEPWRGYWLNTPVPNLSLTIPH